MNKNQKGFALVEAVIIFVVVGVIGFGAYYFWNSNKEGKETPAQANSAKEETTKTEQVNTREKLANVQQKYTVEVPEGWKGIERASFNSGPYNELKLTSPDYEDTRPDGIDLITKGAAISVWTYVTNGNPINPDKMIAETKNSSEPSESKVYKGEIDKISVAGLNGVKYLWAHEGAHYTVEFTKDNKNYYVVLEVPISNIKSQNDLKPFFEPYIDQFDTVVNSLQFTE